MTTAETSATLDEYVRGEMARWTVPGVAVGILRDGQRELTATASPASRLSSRCGQILSFRSARSRRSTPRRWS